MAQNEFCVHFTTERIFVWLQCYLQREGLDLSIVCVAEVVGYYEASWEKFSIASCCPYVPNEMLAPSFARHPLGQIRGDESRGPSPNFCHFHSGLWPLSTSHASRTHLSSPHTFSLHCTALLTLFSQFGFLLHDLHEFCQHQFRFPCFLIKNNSRESSLSHFYQLDNLHFRKKNTSTCTYYLRLVSSTTEFKQPISGGCKLCLPRSQRKLITSALKDSSNPLICSLSFN